MWKAEGIQAGEAIASKRATSERWWARAGKSGVVWGPAAPRGVEGLDFAFPRAVPFAGWAQRVSGVNSLGICVESLANPLKGSCP